MGPGEYLGQTVDLYDGESVYARTGASISQLAPPARPPEVAARMGT